MQAFWKALILGWKSCLKHLLWFELVMVRANEMAGYQNAGVTLLLEKGTCRAKATPVLTVSYKMMLLISGKKLVKVHLS